MVDLSTPQKRALVILVTWNANTLKTVDRAALLGTRRVMFSTLQALENKGFIHIGYRQNAKDDVIHVLPAAFTWVANNPDCKGLV